MSINYKSVVLDPSDITKINPANWIKVQFETTGNSNIDNRNAYKILEITNLSTATLLATLADTEVTAIPADSVDVILPSADRPLIARIPPSSAKIIDLEAGNSGDLYIRFDTGDTQPAAGGDPIFILGTF